MVRSIQTLDFPIDSDGEGSACNAGRPGFDPSVGKIPWKREWHPTPLFLPGEFHAQRRLAVHSPQDSDTTEQLTCTHTHTHTHVQTLRLSFSKPALCLGYINHILHPSFGFLGSFHNHVSSRTWVSFNSLPTESWLTPLKSEWWGLVQFVNQHNRKF